MYEIEKVEFNKWVKTLNDAQLSKYDVSLINLIIENFDEIPYGMEDTITNMRNRRANARARAQRITQ